MEEVRSNLIVLGIFVEEPEGYVHPKELWSSMSGAHRYIHIIVYKYMGTYTSIDISKIWKNQKRENFGEKGKIWEKDKFGKKAQFEKKAKFWKTQKLRKMQKNPTLEDIEQKWRLIICMKSMFLPSDSFAVLLGVALPTRPVHIVWPGVGKL